MRPVLMATLRVMNLPSPLAPSARGSSIRQSALLRVGWPYVAIFLDPCLGFPWAASPLLPLSDVRSNVLV
eukprot:12756576-Heterocapsa_arctica.AAC.1